MQKIPFFVFLSCASVLFLATLAFGQDNWPRLRGADATGVVADDPQLPDTWDQTQNVQWKVTIPGWGWGSPIVWGDCVFVSAVHSDDEYVEPKSPIARMTAALLSGEISSRGE